MSSSRGSDFQGIDGRLDRYLIKVTILDSIQTLTFNGEFDSAHAFVDIFLRDRPDEPVGWLARSGLILAQMSENEQDSRKDEFKEAIDSVLLKAEVFEDSCFYESAMLHMVRGHARSYLAMYESKFGSSLSAIRQGYKAKGEYEAGLRCDSSFYDLYLGLGGFHYWKSVKAGILRKVKVFSNDIELGLKELKLTIDSSDFSGELARNALISICLNQKKYDSALVICSTMIEKYPHGTIFLWPSGIAYYKSGQYEKSVEVFEQLRAHYHKQPGNYFNMIECDHMITESLKELGRKKDAAKSAARFTEYESVIPKNTRKRQSDKIRYLQWWAKKIDFY